VGESSPLLHPDQRLDLDRQERLAAISDRLRLRRSRERRSERGELWLDHLCLFHDDDHVSATWQEQTAVYHCWAEDRTYELEEVERFLNQSTSEPIGVAKATHAPPRTSISQTVEVVNETFYEYTYPDGRFSHTHIRRDYSDGSKLMPYRDADGTWTRHDGFWPLYDERRLLAGCVVFVVEGEKCVDYVAAMDDSYNGVPIRAITASSAAECKKYSPEIAARLLTLNPAAILVWPDNDMPGIECMKAVKEECEKLHLPAAIVEPIRYSLQDHEDAADYIEAGGALAVVVNDYWNSLHAQQNGSGLNQQRLKLLIDSTAMMSPSHFVFSATQTPLKVDMPNLEALWQHSFDVMPGGSSTRELRAGLIAKGVTAPTDIAFRHLAAENVFWWRPTTNEPCYQVMAEEIKQVDNPPGTMILVPRSSPRFSSQVDLEGDAGDFNKLCRAFGLDETSESLLLTWLVSALTGRKTPILLFKGGAATGKTTLATYLCSIVDPDVPTLAAQKVERDLREFVRTAQRHPALLLDNVGTVPPDVEDALSKLVTGEAAPLRVLYEDVIETIHLQRAICVTTTAWDISKGDLASRMWPIEPVLPKGSYLDEDDIAAMFDPLVPRLRGYAFKTCQSFYRRSREFTSKTTPLRVGGRVLQTLGFDADAIAKSLNLSRARVISEGEPWLDALVDLWNGVKDGGPFDWSPTDLCQFLKDQTHDEPSAKMLANFIRPRQAIFTNYGFSLTWGRVANKRFYHFTEVTNNE
jgi:hypothetical protein